MEDCLNIGVDISKGKDNSALTIVRYANGKIQVLNTLYGKEAEDIYYKLTNKEE